ncbi:hypothetical protein EIP91_010827 [Steccherinum ochraceum]|uniref:DUF6924 domain-containing protein n=1 Tax=Steccherinum ochraceum TaxID=92696 RepID=A0A4R0RLI7_9APHY|nr:hypothetical protein EIP91_010827 [Steccherinum ochraceum]
MVERRNQIALYVSSASVTAAQVQRLQHIFDTFQELPEVPVMPDFIHAVDGATWALNLDPEPIYKKHKSDYSPEYFEAPILILDERSAKDDTVVVVHPEYVDQDTYKHIQLRSVPEKVSLLVANLEIANTDLFEMSEDLDADGVYR